MTWLNSCYYLYLYCITYMYNKDLKKVKYTTPKERHVKNYRQTNTFIHGSDHNNDIRALEMPKRSRERKRSKEANRVHCLDIQLLLLFFFCFFCCCFFFVFVFLLFFIFFFFFFFSCCCCCFLIIGNRYTTDRKYVCICVKWVETLTSVGVHVE